MLPESAEDGRGQPVSSERLERVVEAGCRHDDGHESGWFMCYIFVCEKVRALELRVQRIFPHSNRTLGPLTGGAEVTGSSNMLPPAHPEREPPSAASGAPASGPGQGGNRPSSATPAPTSTGSGAFVELKEPLLLAWNISLVPRGRGRLSKRTVGVSTEAAGQSGEESSDRDNDGGGAGSQDETEAGRRQELMHGQGRGDDAFRDPASARDRSEEVGTRARVFHLRDATWARMYFAERKR